MSMSKKEKQAEHAQDTATTDLDTRLAALEAKVDYILERMKPIAYKCGVSYAPPEKQTEETYKE